MEDMRKEEQVEKLLRGRGPVPLSQDFKRNVMNAIARLPVPAFIRPRGLALLRSSLRLLSGGELTALLLIIAGLAALMLPGVGALLDNIEWDLADLHVSLVVGSSAVSGSVTGLIAIVFGLGMMAMAGAYVSRNHLIHA